MTIAHKLKVRKAFIEALEKIEKEWRNVNPQNRIDPQLLDQITQTMTELNKAMGNLQFVVKTTKSLDLPNLFRSLSSNNVQQLVKGIDLQQVSAILQSPLIRQMLTDPEFFALFAPDAGTSPGTPPNAEEDSEKESSVDTNQNGAPNEPM
jgi:hypothetical protein